MGGIGLGEGAGGRLLFHHVEADVGGLRVDGGKDEDGDGHEGGGDEHGHLPAEDGHSVHH